MQKTSEKNCKRFGLQIFKNILKYQVTNKRTLKN